MKCKNCGAENPESSKFCASCGQLLTAEQPSQQANPSAQQPQQQQPRAGKAAPLPKTALIGAGVGVVALIAVGSIVVHNGKTINLNKYLTVEVTGYDGYGKATAVIDWDAIEKKYGSKISFTSAAKKQYGDILSWTTPIEVLREDISVDFETDTRHLSNGDMVEYAINVDDELADLLKCKIKHKAGNYTVSDLEEVDTFDAFADLDVEFSGIAPEGTANLNYTGMIMTTSDFSCDKTKGLSNGDTVTVTIPDDKAESYVQSIGQIPAELEKTYTVEGLESYLMHISEIDDAALQSMQTQASDVYNAYVAKNWYEGESLESFDYIGTYLLTAKNANAYSYDTNKLYLVYKVKVHNTYSSDYGSYDQVNSIYWYISFHNLKIGQDGSVTVDLSDYDTTSWRDVMIDSGVNEYSWGSTRKWNYVAYATLDDLYKDAVTRNIETFNHEDNVTDNA